MANLKILDSGLVASILPGDGFPLQRASGQGYATIGEFASALVGGTPGQIIFNNDGAFGGSVSLTWDDSIKQLLVSTDGTNPDADTTNFLAAFHQEITYNSTDYQAFQPFVFSFKHTASGQTGADFFPAVLFEGRLDGGNYLTDSDGLQMMNIAPAMLNGATAAYLIALDVGPTVLNSGTVTNAYSIRAYDFLETGSTVGTFTNFAASNYAGPPSNRNAMVTTRYQFYGEDLGAFTNTTNKYYAWFDSRGVVRWRDDAFDGAGNEQAIGALYNPRFTKYTPGATNYERVIYGQWNSNVAEIGTEKGGTGTLRNLRLIGAGVEYNGLTTGGLTLTGTSASILSAGPGGTTNPVLQVDASVASQAAGIKIIGGATGTVTFTAIDSGSNTNVVWNPKGSGTFGIGTALTIDTTGDISLNSSGNLRKTSAASFVIVSASSQNIVLSPGSSNVICQGNIQLTDSGTYFSRAASGKLSINANLTGIGTGTGTPTYVLHIAPTSGAIIDQTFLCMDNTTTTGSTQGIFKAGAAQSTKPILTVHDGTNPVHQFCSARIGLFGVTPAVRTPAWTITNDTTDRTFDANATTIDEIADCLATLIKDFQTYGLTQ